jgi:replicative DNA helicase
MTGVRERQIMDELFAAGLHRASIADEQAVLGAMMQAAPSSGIPGSIRVWLRPRDPAKGSGEHHFTVVAHQIIWKTIVELMDAGQPHDPICVAAHMTDEQLIRTGGVPYLHTCANAVPSIGNGTAYARDLVGATLLRDMAGAAAQQVQRAVGSSLHTAVDTFNEVRALLDDIEVPAPGDGPVNWLITGAEVNDEMERLEAIAQNPELITSEFTTGWYDVDKLICPVVPGAMIVIAGRPGMAKTTTAVSLVTHLALEKRLPVLFFSLEMSRLEIGLKVMCNRARVPTQAVKNGTLSDEDWADIGRVLGRDQDAPLEIDESTGITTDYIDRTLAAFVREHGRPPVAFVVDHIGWIQEHGGTSDQERTSRISNKLKMLAKKYETVCVALSQLNRGPEQRAGGVPQLSDLRNSGSIEQDADVVALLYREDYYDKDSPRRGEMDFMIVKHRNGPTETIPLAAQLHLSRIVSMAI